MAAQRDKQAKKKARRAKRAESWGRHKQIWEAFKMQRRDDKALIPWMVAAFLGSVAVVFAIGLFFDYEWWSLPIGIALGVLAAMSIFGRRVQRNVYAKADGQPGAAGWALDNMRGPWRVTQAVAGTTHLDAVHRVIGRPGIILVAEGAPHRVKGLLGQEKKRTARVAGSMPIYDIVVGNDEGQVPLTHPAAPHLQAAAQHQRQGDGRARGPAGGAGHRRGAGRCPRARCHRAPRCAACSGSSSAADPQLSRVLPATRCCPSVVARRFCCTAQLFPSGSLKCTNPTLSSALPSSPSFIGRRPASPYTCTSEASTPRSTSWACAARMSGTTSCTPSSEPGAIPFMPFPITIEQPDPGGVSWTKRSSSLILVSWSTVKPSWSA